MTSQQAFIGGIIAGMKKAVKRKAYDSDSDSSIEHLTNRGNKLRKKARYVHEGQLAAPTGPHVYKRQIEHAGYHRDIISLNPPLVDDSGNEIESDDDDEREAALPVDFDPYAEVHIEHLLAPLTSASDLPNHPTLSKPFTSKALTELTKHAGEMLQKEKASLWRIKHLLTRLSGDNTWIPCESVETQHDFDLFLDDRDRLHVKLPEKIIVEDGDQVSTGTLLSEESHVRSLALEDSSKVPDLNRTRQISTTAAKNDDLDTSSSNTPQDLPSGGSKGVSETLDRAQLYELKKAQSAKGNTHIALEVDHDESGDVDVAAIIPSRNEDEPQPLLEEVESADTEDSPEDAGEPAPRRMRTRAQAQAASENTASSRARSLSPDFNEDIFVSQFFLAPRSSHPDRDLGLPQHEADDIRRLLQLYIQKQEEVCRGVQKVYDGLMKADRYRNQVMKWAKAEGHVGVNRDMSDGEDWYDKEEWGLDEDLKKGQDEEEEDAATTAKKTRTRRQ